MKSGFCCPVCGSALERGEKILTCENGHSFDIAKKGYVNLLLSQKSNAGFFLGLRLASSSVIIVGT